MVLISSNEFISTFDLIMQLFAGQFCYEFLSKNNTFVTILVSSCGLGLGAEKLPNFACRIEAFKSTLSQWIL